MDIIKVEGIDYLIVNGYWVLIDGSLCFGASFEERAKFQLNQAIKNIAYNIEKELKNDRD